MNFGEFMGLALAVGGLIAIVDILGRTYRRRLEHKERLAEIKAGAPAQVPAPPAELERLEHRLRVLERIATDKSSNLAAQIEDLRAPAN